MKAIIERWLMVLRTDAGLQERLRRLNANGLPATKRGDLLFLKIDHAMLVVSWNGTEIQIEERKASNPFCRWAMNQKQFNQLLQKSGLPILVAMNKNQANIKMGIDHHNGSLVVSFLVMLQESMIGGEST